MLGTFTRDLHRHLEGTPDKHGLLQRIRPAQLAFKRAIRGTAPNFLPYERKQVGYKSVPAPQFLLNEENDGEESDEYGSQTTDAICIDEVLTRAEE
jgi:hypothetical protein